MNDPNTELGAQRLAALITSMWRGRAGGERVEVWVEARNFERLLRDRSFVVRSNLVNGLPPRLNATSERNAA